MRSPIFRRIKKYLFLYIVLVLVLYIVCEFQNYTIDGSVMNQPPRRGAKKSLILNKYRVFWSLEVTPQMHELAACDSFFPITRI